MLYIVPTPIGNLKDITLRALDTLGSVDAVVCEDTRQSSQLLRHFQISKPLLVLNDYNEKYEAGKILQRLKEGQNLALVSDAGTPLISDPGYRLVRSCLAEGLPVDSLPGPTSPVTALTLSGLPPDKFLFLGYLPEKPGHRLEMINKLLQIQGIIALTAVIFVAPHKLVRTLQNLQEVLGDREVVLTHELTKIHQSVENSPISALVTKYTRQKPRGEYVLLLGPLAK